MQKRKKPMLSEEARQAKLEYYRAYRANNREKIKESNRKYWENRAAKIAAEQEANNGKNPS